MGSEGRGRSGAHGGSRPTLWAWRTEAEAEPMVGQDPPYGLGGPRPKRSSWWVETHPMGLEGRDRSGAHGGSRPSLWAWRTEAEAELMVGRDPPYGLGGPRPKRSSWWVETHPMGLEGRGLSGAHGGSRPTLWAWRTEAEAELMAGRDPPHVSDRVGLDPPCAAFATGAGFAGFAHCHRDAVMPRPASGSGGSRPTLWASRRSRVERSDAPRRVKNHPVRSTAG
jgi:hypothetical protein